MNTTAIAQHLNVIDSAIIEIQEWATVLWVKFQGGCRFVSKKINEVTKMQFTKQGKKGLICIKFTPDGGIESITLDGKWVKMTQIGIRKAPVKGMGEQWIAGGIVMLDESDMVEIRKILNSLSQKRAIADAAIKKTNPLDTAESQYWETDRKYGFAE